MSPAHALFWICALALVYLYAGYPILIRVWAWLRPWRWVRGNIRPEVTVLVVAQDEAARIGKRIADLLRLAYPRERLEIVVASDGSMDGTVERARAYGNAGVRIVAFPGRRGKAAVLNDLVPGARGEIVVLADARQEFDPGALRAIVAPFADPRVGAVSGKLVLGGATGQGGSAPGVGVYWRYETAIRWSESRVDSTIGATGAIYAIRRDLFEPIPADTILDDVLIPMRITRRGYRVLLEPGARARDRPSATAAQEFARKARTLAGNFQLFAREPWLLNPLRNRLWLQTVSHKGLRLLGPPLLVGLLGTNLLLAESQAYRLTLLGQVLFYAAAATGGLVQRWGGRVPPLAAAYAFCLLNAATVAGFFRFVAGRQGVTWKRPAAGPADRTGWPLRDTARR